MRNQCLLVIGLAVLFAASCSPSPSTPIVQPVASTATLSPSSPATPTGTTVIRALPAASTTPPLLPSATSNQGGQGGQSFDGNRAYQAYLKPQMEFGSRPVGSAALRATGDFIISDLKQSQWQVVTQEFEYRRLPIRNIIGKAGQGRGPVIIIGAHYDTRLLADQDKTDPTQPVLGANDGASGVAVLLELAHTLDVSKLKNEVWLAFFDAEDNGEIPGCKLAPPPCADNSAWPWSVGAEYMADHIAKPATVIVVDMIGDKDQNIYYEKNSDVQIQQQLWGIAARLGYQKQFIPQEKWSMEDDHTPFLQRGIRAVDMIDFDYPYWHTGQDTADKVSPDSLERVGRVLQAWLQGN